MAIAITTSSMRKEANNAEVTRITYSNKDESKPFSIFRVKGLTAPVKGAWLAKEGELLDLKLRHNMDPRFGENWVIEQVVPAVRVTTAAGVARWLCTKVHGLGETKASLLVARFGDQLNHVVTTDPKQLKLVPGLGPKLIARIQEALADEGCHHENLKVCLSHGMTPHQANKLILYYGAGLMEVLRTNPYQTTEISRIGFKLADGFARSFGIPLESPFRLQAGIIHVLEEAKTQGNCGLTFDRLIKGARRVLAVDKQMPGADSLSLVLEECVKTSRLVKAPVGHLGGELCYFLPYLARTEKKLAAELYRLATAELKTRMSEEGLRDLFAWAAKTGDPLTDEQQQAVRQALNSPVSIITGGPGVGKSATLRVILEGLKRLGEEVVMMALSGKAAQRMSGATGYPADTIHSQIGLRVDSEDAEYNSANPLDCTSTVLDELSMLDIETALPALCALETGTRILLVGDVDQLASVGPGKLLFDLIHCGCFPVTYLTKFFRFGNGSGIKAAAHAVNKGFLPDWEDSPDADCRLIEVETDVLADAVVERIRHYHNQGYALTDIQVLAPVYKGNAGIDLLNEKILSAFRPAGVASVSLQGRTIAVGDSLLWRKADRTAMINGQLKKIINGDVGIVTKIDKAKQEMTLALDATRQAVIKLDTAFKNTSPACAISTHKSQGSQWRVVLQVVTSAHQFMLTRNLVYTGMTRAQERMEIIGNAQGLLIAAKTPDASERCSRLMDELQDIFQKHVF